MSDEIDEVTITVEENVIQLVVGDRVIASESGPATQIVESSGPTTLTVGAVSDGQYLRRVGSTIVGAAVSGGGGSSNSYTPSGW